MNSIEKLNRDGNLPYTIHKYKLVDAQYMTFMAPPTKRFVFNGTSKPHNFNGKWRYKAQLITGNVWVSVDIGVGFKEVDNEQLLKRVKADHINAEDDWDKIYALARNMLGI